MKFYLTTIFLSFLFTVSFAQNNATDNKLVQFSGIVSDADSNIVVPYVTITNLSNKLQKYAANYQGYFSVVVQPGDSLTFSAVGFTSKTIVLPKHILDNKYTAMIQLKSEVVYLKTVRVNPWATVEEFNKDFLALKVADDDMAIAKKNLSRSSINGLKLTLPRDASEIGNANYRYNFDRMVNSNMRQTNPLLNPFNWGKLMQQIFDGDKARGAN